MRIESQKRRRTGELRGFLERRRQEVMAALHEFRGTAAAESPATKDPDDHAVEDLARGMECALAEMKAATLQRIDDAIHRLGSGTYGVCTDCGSDIDESRLRALPFAPRCRHCQADRESAEAAVHPLESGAGTRPWLL
jgi:DnaK suppressor protein